MPVKEGPNLGVMNYSTAEVPGGAIAPGRTGLCPHCQKQTMFLGDEELWRWRVSTADPPDLEPTQDTTIIPSNSRAGMIHVVHCAGCHQMIIDLVWTPLKGRM